MPTDRNPSSSAFLADQLNPLRFVPSWPRAQDVSIVSTMESKTIILIESSVAIILIILALIIIVWNLYKHWKDGRVKSWPKARGRIMEALVKPVDSPVGAEYRRASEIRPVTGSQVRYQPMVTYTYQVSGSTYRNTEFMYNGADSYTDVEIKALMGNYEVGSNVPVLYNPSNPDESYLYAGDVDWWPLWLGVVFLLLAAALGGHAYYLRRKSKKAMEGERVYMNVDEFTMKGFQRQQGGACLF